MLSHASLVYATFLIQAMEALVVAGVLTGFRQRRRHAYLGDWARAWWAMAAYLLLGAAGLSATTALGALNPASLAVAGAAFVAGYWNVAWLLLGCQQVLAGKPMTPRGRRRLFTAMAALGLASTALFPVVPASLAAQFYVRVSVRALPAAVACLGIGWVLARRAGSAAARPLGSRFAAGSFLLYGLGQAGAFALGVLQLARGDVFAAVGYLGLVDLFLLSGLGLGMLVWLLEEEQRRAALASDEAAHLARRDPLTGLANRRDFLDRLEALLAAPEGVDELRHRGGAVIYLDLDRFKVINDSMGHPFGDRVLKALARRLSAALGEHETVARCGGDEFILLLPGVADEAAAEGAARQFLDLLRQPLKVSGREVFVGACAGVSLYPRDGADAQRLVKNAETALHGAKEAGGSGLRLFQPRMHVEANRTLSLETRLRRALDNDELTLFYQPVLDLGADRLVGFEALMRWRLRPHRYLRPDRFLPLAESIGLVEEFDSWALATAARQLSGWHAAGYDGLYVAVNLSARRFENPDLPQRVGEALRRNDLPPDALELEITETVAMRDPVASSKVLEALKELGVRVAIDDFGTAYSSLLYLRTFPIDSLKIDRSFVHGIVDEVADQEIAASLIRLAHALGVAVVGEGVETAEQLEALRLHGCDRAQGYYLSPPAAADECDRLLERGPWRPARGG